eukprot:GILK01013506.1.p1 GENE.GILK01013506.1~~GILK01013506.1.p1  ORF type:complete len:318 (+),score=44.49 GILK01013506.1:51-1004(+)
MSEVVLYNKVGKIAFITLNRPSRFNAIDPELPRVLESCVQRANNDDDVHVIVLQGAGKAFCSGYDLKIFAETPKPIPGSQNMPWDPYVDFKLMYGNTMKFMSLWKSLKPVICKVHGYAIAGGSDIALCCDLIVMAEDAKIGYPPARVWGVPTTAMWVHRVGPERAKRLLLTGDIINGKEAERIGLVSAAVPAAELDEYVLRLANRVASTPKNQLFMCKQLVNQAYENMGLHSSQLLATLFDGIARHSPEGVYFKEQVEKHGFNEVVKMRDSGVLSFEHISRPTTVDSKSSQSGVDSKTDVNGNEKLNGLPPGRRSKL